MKISSLIVCLFLLGGCYINKTNNGNGEPVVSPTNISDHQQGNESLYLEDTEHWWEVCK